MNKIPPCVKVNPKSGNGEGWTPARRQTYLPERETLRVEFYLVEGKPAMTNMPAETQWFFYPVAGGRVIEVNLYSMYETGSRARKLLELTANDKRGEVGRTLVDAYSWISAFQREAQHGRRNRNTHRR